MEWVKCCDRMPDLNSWRGENESDNVLFWFDNDVTIGFYEGGRFEKWVDKLHDYDWVNADKVTHWMPLPTQPKE